jgi:hypothetical protein
MRVARHEMHGNAGPRNQSGTARCDSASEDVLVSCTMNKAWRHESYRFLRDGSLPDALLAFHAWLPSFRPCGTIELQPNFNRNRWLRNDPQASP